MSRFAWFISFVVLLGLVLPARLMDKRNRSKRFLLFPRAAPTRHQFIAGLGIPADLNYESLSIGHVLKTEFFLPFNETVFRQNPFLPEYNNKFVEFRNILEKPSQLRWQIYAYIEHMLSGVVHELLHLMLSPSTTLNEDDVQSDDFQLAQQTGASTGSCELYDCNMKLLDWFSKVMQLNY
ncbi:GH21440 [Drosophila grimshawi]|uniref:GH21440 n=1 Tax=Drosophila grimshawi TaxID=7222 RepID=B4J9F5_DROGR|nr:GH21440 [Drosophila grimshawi]